jgi:signal transduction histidine kinase
MIVVALTCLVLLASSSCLAGSLGNLWKGITTKLEVRIETVEGEAALMPLDADGDGNDELFCFSPKVFYFLSLDHWEYMHSYWNDKLWRVFPNDFDGDSLPDYICSEVDSAFFRLKVIAGADLIDISRSARESRLICERRIEWNGENFKGALIPFASYDINGDGVRDLLCSIAAGAFEKQPRGIVAVDGANGQDLWHNYFGPWPKEPRLSDINGDGIPEIVLVGQSVSNGSEANGISDFTCLMIAIDLQGEFLWKPCELGGGLTRAYYDLLYDPASGDSDIVVGTLSQDASAPEQRIVRISGSQGSVKFGGGSSKGFSAVKVLDDWDSDKPAVAAATIDGKVMVLSGELHLLTAYTYPANIELNLSTPIDVDDDGSLELPVLTADNSFLFLNSKVKPVVGSNFADRLWSIAPVTTRDANGHKFLARCTQAAYIAHVVCVNKSADELFPWSARIAMASLIALVMVREIYIRQRRKYYAFLDAFFKDDTRAVIGVDEKNHIFRSNSRADEVLGLGESRTRRITLEQAGRGALKLTELPSRVSSFLAKNLVHDEFSHRADISGHGREFLVQLIRPEVGPQPRSRKLVIMIQDITELSQAKQYEVLSTVAKGLVHDVKKPLAPLKVMIQDLGWRIETGKLDMNTVGETYIDPSVRQLDQMTRWIDRFGEFCKIGLNPKCSVSLGTLVEQEIELRRSLIPANVLLEFTKSNEELVVRGVREELERALCNLIENALSALKGQSSPIIAISASRSDRKPHCAVVRVKDNGCGISQDDLPRIFDVGYSSRKEGHMGLGLTIVQKIVNGHGGSIEVLSQVGVGTEFAVYLPLELEEEPSGKT